MQPAKEISTHALWASLRRAASGQVLLSASGLACTNLRAGDFSFGGNGFTDISQLAQDDRSGPTRSSAAGMDLKRLHFDADHAFDPTRPASLTTDSHWFRRHSEADLRVKYLDAQRKFGGAIVVRIGVHGMPMLALNSQWHGCRYIDSIRTSMQKIDSGAGGNVPVKRCRVPTVDLAMPVVSGGDYEEPAYGHRADLATLFAWHAGKHAVLALGGYDGQFSANDVNRARPLHHTARRIDLIATHTDDIRRFVVRGAHERNWPDWAVRQMTTRWSGFIRNDHMSPCRLLDPSRKAGYAEAGVELKPLKRRRGPVVQAHRAATTVKLVRSSRKSGIWTESAFGCGGR